MKTNSIIQSVANVVRITQLKKGDVYKRLTDSSYDSDKIQYGVVVDILNDGEKTFIEAIEYKKSYSDIEATIKIHRGNDDISIFPVELDEVEKYLQGSIESIEKKIEEKKKELYQLSEGLGRARQFVSGELSKKLTMPDFKEMSQSEYNEQKRIKEAKMQELI